MTRRRRKTKKRNPDAGKCRVCGKEVFHSKIAAKARLARLEARDVEVRRPYYSPRCGCYHLTSRRDKGKEGGR